MAYCTNYWDSLAINHSCIEDNYFDLSSLKNIINNIHGPVLVVGAGLGLVVEELQKRGYKCDGVDLSNEMIKFAEKYRGIKLIKADAKNLPFENGKYQTTICPTGIFDFITDEKEIKLIINEVKRVTHDSGNIFISFVRITPHKEEFLIKTKLINNNIINFKEVMESYFLNHIQFIKYTANRANISLYKAFLLILKIVIKNSMKEMIFDFNMRKIVKQIHNPESFINSVPEKLNFVNESILINLFKRLDIPIKKLLVNEGCFVVQLQ